MILYLDTGALVKRYFREPFSEEIVSRWGSAAHLVTSFVAYAETMAALHRKKREANVVEDLFRRIAGQFHEDWQAFVRVEAVSYTHLRAHETDSYLVCRLLLEKKKKNKKKTI